MIKLPVITWRLSWRAPARCPFLPATAGGRHGPRPGGTGRPSRLAPLCLARPYRRPRCSRLDKIKDVTMLLMSLAKQNAKKTHTDLYLVDWPTCGALLGSSFPCFGLSTSRPLSLVVKFKSLDCWLYKMSACNNLCDYATLSEGQNVVTCHVFIA